MNRKERKSEQKPTEKPKKAAKPKQQSEPLVTVVGDMTPYLTPGPYVSYSDDSNVTAEAARICQGLTDPMEILQAVQEYVCRRLHYDYIKAVTVEPGYVPDPDAIL